MATFETPYGTVDAPDLSAAQKWIARQKASPAPTGGPGVANQPSGATQAPEPTKDLSGAPAGDNTPGTLESLWKGLVHGAGNVVQGGARIGARMGQTPEIGQTEPRFTPERVRQVDETARQREEAYRGPFAPGPGKPLSAARAHPIASGVGEVVGEGAALAAEAGPLAAVSPGSAGLRTAWNALLGAGGALSTPRGGEPMDPASQAKRAGAGGLAGAVTGAASSMMAPVISPEARSLTQQGVRLTPGQTMPGSIQAAERTLQQFPIVRGYVNRMVSRSVEDFNRAVGRQVLAPIGGIVPNTVKAGHPLAQFVEKQLDTAYDRIKPNLSLSQAGTAEVMQNTPALTQLVSELPEDLQRRFATIMQNRVLGRFQDGKMDGETFKKMEGYLSRRAAAFEGTQDGELGEALKETMKAMRDQLVKENPQFGPDLQKINQAWSLWVRMREAGSRRSAASGIFTPADLLAAVKRESTDSQFYKGDGLLQVLGEAGEKVLSGSLTKPNDRLRWGDILMGATSAVPYGLAAGAQKLPAVGRGIGAMAPAAGAAAEPVGQRKRSGIDVPPPPSASP